WMSLFAQLAQLLRFDAGTENGGTTAFTHMWRPVERVACDAPKFPKMDESTAQAGWMAKRKFPITASNLSESPVTLLCRASVSIHARHSCREGAGSMKLTGDAGAARHAYEMYRRLHCTRRRAHWVVVTRRRAA